MGKILKHILLSSLAGILLGVSVDVLFLSTDLIKYASKAEAFRQVRLGMSRQEMQSILSKKGVQCISPYSVGGESVICKFSDFWREYHIGLSPARGEVARKSFAFRHQANILDRLDRLSGNAPVRHE